VCVLAAALAASFAPSAARAPEQEPGTWRRITAPLSTSFPRDHGAHFDCRTEWWYATGELATASGAQFGFQVTIFRQGADPEPLPEGASPLRVKHVYSGHFVLIELATGALVHAERLRRATPGLAYASAETLDTRLESWRIALDASGALVITADDVTRGIALALTLTPEKPLVLHGAEGISRKGDAPGDASAYASWTRLAARGSLVRGGASEDVSGGAWFDHEWGSSQLGAGVLGWDWFALRLDDGRELMAYRLRRADGSAHPASSATLVERDGRATYVPLAGFTCEVSRTWTSPRTGAVYPARWRIRVAQAALDVEVAARVPDCEIDGRASTGVIYWEGPVAVTGSAAGTGYAELTGYAGSLARRF
jgi:predicted secreted hydrolase